MVYYPLAIFHAIFLRAWKHAIYIFYMGANTYPIDFVNMKWMMKADRALGNPDKQPLPSNWGNQMKTCTTNADT